MRGEKEMKKIGVASSRSLERGRKENKRRDEENENEGTPLWRLFNGTRQDSFEMQILPKLATNDVKFLYNCNKNSRDTIKRSGIKVPDKFVLREITSRQTLKFAWERCRFDCCCENCPNRAPHNAMVLECVARSGNLEHVKWLREKEKCAWDEKSFLSAVLSGNLVLCKYLMKKNCPHDCCSCMHSTLDNGVRSVVWKS